MKTLEEILAYEIKAFDARDITRLTAFMTAEQVEAKGLTFCDEATKNAHKPEEFTEANIKKYLQKDLDFAFEKALNKRGLSAGLMVSVVDMWVWILGDDVGASPVDDYAQYGLPYLKAVALFYGFENPIGDDTGSEFKYSAEGDYDD